MVKGKGEEGSATKCEFDNASSTPRRNQPTSTEKTSQRDTRRRGNRCNDYLRLSKFSNRDLHQRPIGFQTKSDDCATWNSNNIQLS